MRFISVDFPEPDGPMIATYSPRSMAIETPRRAWISSSPITYVFQRSRVSIRDMVVPASDDQTGSTVGQAAPFHFTALFPRIPISGGTRRPDPPGWWYPPAPCLRRYHAATAA